MSAYEPTPETLAPRPARDVVSVIMPVRNEVASITEAISSLLGQRQDDFELEILAVDGCSSDGTRDILAGLAAGEPRLRVLDNPDRHTPHAMNVGLGAASGSYVAILGSHCVYDADYIAVCLDELRRHAAVGCTGRVVVGPANRSRGAQLAAWAFASPFASSGKSFRTAPEGYADSINFPVFEKLPLLEIGGYNERLERNQDNDLNSRLRAAGHRLYLTHRTKCVYRAQPGVRALMRYAFRNGYWNALTLRENARAMSTRHLVPLAFVLGLLVLAAGGLAGLALDAGPSRWLWLVPALAVVGLNLLGGAYTAAQVGWQSRRAIAALVPPVILGFHLSYGTGSLVGLLSGRRPSEAPGPAAGPRAEEPAGAASSR